MSQDDRLMNTGFRAEDEETELSLRPHTLSEYFGQKKIKDSLSIYMQAAAARNEAAAQANGMSASLKDAFSVQIAHDSESAQKL